MNLFDEEVSFFVATAAKPAEKKWRECSFVLNHFFPGFCPSRRRVKRHQIVVFLLSFFMAGGGTYKRRARPSCQGKMGNI